MEARLKRSEARERNTDGEAHIAALFDAMAEEYDDITDFWYAWLFSRMHYFLAQFLANIDPKREFVDVGCGTGFQTNLIALFGHDVIGVDIAGQLIHKARRKQPETYLYSDLFRSPFEFSGAYSRRIRQLAQAAPSHKQQGRVAYCQASATHLPFGSNTRDAVVCCGSTLNFVNDYGAAIREMKRVLRSGGLLILEVENRYNPDLIWALLESLLPINLGFEQDRRTAAKNLTAPRASHVFIDYPFETQSGIVHMPLRLFSGCKFERELQTSGFRVVQTHAIHSVTNFLPSTVLHTPHPGRILRAAAGALAKCEELLGELPIIRHLGCSLVYFCTKDE